MMPSCRGIVTERDCVNPPPSRDFRVMPALPKRRQDAWPTLAVKFYAVVHRKGRGKKPCPSCGEAAHGHTGRGIAVLMDIFAAHARPAAGEFTRSDGGKPADAAGGQSDPIRGGSAPDGWPIGCSRIGPQEVRCA